MDNASRDDGGLWAQALLAEANRDDETRQMMKHELTARGSCDMLTCNDTVKKTEGQTGR
jgi:hypothetical protein